MASFTDAIPQFNPYIQQLPVEAMVSVGMQKQQQYDQGIQRIQSQIDQVAGLDIVRNVDRKYLQSKLNDLGSKLRTVAAGDFSNFQLVNSVAGMAGKVAKDNNVINAVQSTAKYRKGIQEMEASIKDGKSSASNEWLFGNDASEWLDSDDLNKQFNGRFYQYTNYKKNAVEAIKALTKSKTLTEDAFTIDSKGNMVIADAITRIELAGIPPEQIQQALMASLSPDDFRQMQIDGRYNYSNVSNEQFVTSINDTYKTNLTKYEDKKKFLQGTIDTTNDVMVKESIKQQVADIDKYLIKMKSDYEDVSSTFTTGDIESAKAKLQTRSFIDQFSNAFSFTEISKTYETSPYAEAARFRENLGWEKWKYSDQQSRDEKWKILEYEQKEREIDLKRPVVPKGTVDQAIPQEDIPKLDIPWLMGKIETSSQTLESSDMEFIKKINGVESASTDDLKKLDIQYEEWLKRPESVDSNLRTYFQKTDSQRKAIRSDNNLLAEINTNTERNYPETNLNTIPVSGSTFILTTSNDKKYTVTPRDLLNFSINYENRYNVFDPSKGTGFEPTSFDDDKAKRELSEKDYEIFKKYKKWKNPSLIGGLNESDRRLMSEYNRIKNTAGLEFRNNLKLANEAASQVLTSRYTTTQGLSRPIPLAKPEDKDEFRAKLTGIAEVAEKNNNELANSPNFKYDDLLKIMNSSNISATITSSDRTESQEPIHTIKVIGDGTTTSFRISESQKQSMFPGQYSADPQIQFATPYVDQIRKMGGVSTSLTGKFKSTHDNAFLTKNNFPGVDIYGITADLATLDAGDPMSNYYNLKINIYDPSKGEWVEDIDAFDGAIPVENIYQAMMSLTDVQIFQILNGNRTPTKEELSNLKENSKKPF